MGRSVAVRTGADLGAAVQEARLAAGLTQRQVAELAGIDRTYLARMEAGLSVQLVDRALRVLRRLGAEVTVTLPPGAGSVDPPGHDQVEVSPARQACGTRP